VRRERQISVKLEKTPKDPLDDLEPKMSIEEKQQVIYDFAILGLMLYAGKVAVDATGTIIVHAALKGLK
jgi:hypothetical protein